MLLLTIGWLRGVCRRVRGGGGGLRRTRTLALGARLEVVIVASAAAVDELLASVLERVEVVAVYAEGAGTDQRALLTDITCRRVGHGPGGQWG